MDPAKPWLICQTILPELRANVVRVDEGFSAKPKAEVVEDILASIKERRT